MKIVHLLKKCKKLYYIDKNWYHFIEEYLE